MQLHCGECARVCEAVVDPKAVLLSATLSIALWKLKGLASRHRLQASSPAPGALLVAGEARGLERFLGRLRDSLGDEEIGGVRGVFFDVAQPAAGELARGLLNLADLDRLLTRIRTRWFCRVLQTDALFSVFQPLVSLGDRRVVAHESLLRARLDGEVIGAERLLSTARLMGLNAALEMAARRQAVLRGREVLQQGHKLFVNFEPSIIQNPELCLADLEAACREAGVAMGQLVFEVTETEEVKDLAYLKRIMDEYRRRGAQVALDDLGSGYSSFRYLVELNPDYIKLDRHLVHGALHDRTRSVLLRAITAAARELGIGVIAEGVESIEDLQFCIDAGVDFAQGYFLARPAEIPPRISPLAESMLKGGQRQAIGPAEGFATLPS